MLGILGFGVWGSGSRGLGSGFGFRVQGSDFREQGLGFRVGAAWTGSSPQSDSKLRVES